MNTKPSMKNDNPIWFWFAPTFIKWGSNMASMVPIAQNVAKFDKNGIPIEGY